MLSDFSKNLRETLDLPKTKTRKLVLSLDRKENIVLHIANLLFYLDMGMKLITVHKALKFYQTNWLAPYVEYNTAKRKNAKSNFAKDYHKLLVNSVYGRCLMNVRKHKDIRLVTNQTQMRKLTNKVSFKQMKIIDENLVCVSMKKSNVLLNKLPAVGATVLELSKIKIFDFYYNVLVKKYGSNNISLLMTLLLGTHR